MVGVALKVKAIPEQAVVVLARLTDAVAEFIVNVAEPDVAPRLLQVGVTTQ